jgi:hypothetical protein
MTSLEQSPGLAPSDPQTPAEIAAAQLAERKRDPEWCKRYLEANQAEREEMARLTSAIAAVTPVLDTSAANAALHERETSAAITYLSASGGVTDAAAKQISDPDRKVSRAEYEFAKAWKAARLQDAEWRQRYFRGDVQAVRDLILASVILSSRAEG